MILADSSAWVEYFADRPKAGLVKHHVPRPEETIVPTIVLYEVYKTLKRDVSEDVALAAVALMNRGHVVELDSAVAIAAADVSLAHTLAMADSIIVATARLHGTKIVTLDRDFSDIPEAVVL